MTIKRLNMRWYRGASAAAILFPLPGICSDPVNWEHQYTGEEIPVQASPRWAVNSKAVGSTETVGDGKLDVVVGPEASRFYTIGFFTGEKPAGDASWNGTAGNSTVEIRVSCEAENPEKDIFQISLTDGKLRWDIDFRGDSILAGSKVVPTDTGKTDTYRIVLKDGLMQMTAEDQGMVFDGIKGSPLEDGRNRMVFGTDARSVRGSDLGGGSWTVDFIRWTNKEAAP